MQICTKKTEVENHIDNDLEKSEYDSNSNDKMESGIDNCEYYK